VNAFVRTTLATLDEALALANVHDLGLEIVDFIAPEAIHERADRVVAEYRRRLNGFASPISFHGSFKDIYVNAADPRVRAISQDIVRRNVAVAAAVDSEIVIFHSNFLPLIPEDSYRQTWLQVHAQFWPELLPTAHAQILLENLWDTGPDHFAELFSRVADDRLGMCLDIGHCNVYSHVPLRAWFQSLSTRIRLLHINDNDGHADGELVPGEGSIDWAEVNSLIAEFCDAPLLSLEFPALASVPRAVEALRARRFYRFDS
jgi:sugar phosphate isomerase/epimerase